MKTKKLLALLLAIVVIAALCVTLCACNNQENEQMSATVYEPHLILASTRTSVVRAGVTYPAVDITAYVPIAYDAGDDTLVSWSFAWVEGTPLAAEPVTDYISVEGLPMTSTYQRTARITCLRPFRGSYIVVTATADMSGYEAYCSVGYDGKPDTISVDGNDELYPSGGNSYQAIALDNVFHDVGADFINNVRVESISWSGGYSGATRSINKTTGVVTDTNAGYYEITELKGGVEEYISASVSNGNLYYSVSKSLIGAYSRLTNSADKMTYSKYLISDVDVFVDITLTCEGATCVYQFRIIGTTEGISLEDNAVTF